MSTKPQENMFRIKYRKYIDSFMMKIPLPRINPDYVSYSTLITTLISVYFFVKGNLAYFVIFLFLTLVLDLLDGSIARKYNLGSEKGWILDKVIDRISETILMAFIWLPGLLIVLLNVIIMYLSYKAKFPKPLMFIPPLRVVLLIIYIIILVVN